MITNAGTYRKLEKAGTFPAETSMLQAVSIMKHEFPWFGKDLKVLTRGNNQIAYFRSDNGREVNDKIWMLHWNKDCTITLYL